MLRVFALALLEHRAREQGRRPVATRRAPSVPGADPYGFPPARPAASPLAPGVPAARSVSPARTPRPLPAANAGTRARQEAQAPLTALSLFVLRQDLHRMSASGQVESFAVPPTSGGFTPPAVIARPRLHPPESQRTNRARDVPRRGTTCGSVVEIQRTSEPLNQGDSAGGGRHVRKPAFVTGCVAIHRLTMPSTGHHRRLRSSTWKYSDIALLTLYFLQPQKRLFVTPLDVLIHDGDRVASNFIARCHKVSKRFADCLFRVVGG